MKRINRKNHPKIFQLKFTHFIAFAFETKKED